MKTAIVFIVGYNKDRHGLDDDVSNIYKTFKKLFNAEIQNWTNLNKDKLRMKFKERKCSNTVIFLIPIFDSIKLYAINSIDFENKIIQYQ